MSRPRITVLIGLVTLSAVAVTGLVAVQPELRQASALFAKYKCSEVLLAGRDENVIDEVDLPFMSGAARLWSTRIDEERRMVTSSLLGTATSRAQYRDGVGCAVLRDRPLEEVFGSGEWTALKAGVDPEPLEESILPAVQAVIERALSDNDLNHRAILVLKAGRIIGEGYADGFDRHTPLWSHSMAKSVNGMLFAIADEAGLLDLRAAPAVPEWPAGDPRGAISHAHLINMTSGLAFEEDYAPFGSVLRMLTSGDTAHFAAGYELAREPGSDWKYASSDSNLAARSLGARLGAADEDVARFAQERLFAPIGAAGVVLEFDAADTFVGSSYVYAPARAWARLGLLMERRGRWAGKQVVPESFFTGPPLSHVAQQSGYRNGLWLNVSPEGGARLPGYPSDAQYFNGFLGQMVIAVPGTDTVVVRLGFTHEGTALREFLARLYAAVPEANGAG